MCGSVFNFAHMLSNGVAPNPCPGDAAQLAAQSDAHPEKPAKPFTLERAWKLRCSEIHVLADRADCRCRAARKHPVLADTVLFAEVKEPAAEVQEGEAVKQLLKDFALHRLERTMPAEATRCILAFCDRRSKWHPEQPTLAEFSAHVARDVIAHVELAAEARIKKPRKTAEDACSDRDDQSEASEGRERPFPGVDLVDMGGGAGDDVEEDDDGVTAASISSFPLVDIDKALAMCWQQGDLDAIADKPRLNQADKDLKNLHSSYGPLLQGSFSLPAAAPQVSKMGFGPRYADMLALQKQTLTLAKNQQSADAGADEDPENDDWLPNSGAAQPAVPELVPLPLAMQGPGAVAWKLLTDASCTEEQVSARH